MPAKCPSCSAPLKHYVNSNGTETDYCEYCNYRKDYAAPETTTGTKVINLVGSLLGNTLGVRIGQETKLSPIEIMDREKQEREMLSKMTDKERRFYEKQKALEQKREAAARRAKTFNPRTGMYE